jgi:hypothetical protein
MEMNVGRLLHVILQLWVEGGKLQKIVHSHDDGHGRFMSRLGSHSDTA